MYHQCAIPPGHYAIPSQKGDNLFLSFSLASLNYLLSEIFIFAQSVFMHSHASQFAWVGKSEGGTGSCHLTAKAPRGSY